VSIRRFQNWDNHPEEFRIATTRSINVLSVDFLWQNGYLVQTETGAAVNYKPFPNYDYDFDLEKMEKCGTY